MRRKFFVAAIGLLTAVAVNLVSHVSDAEARCHRGRRARCGTVSCGYSSGCYQGGCYQSGCNTGCAPAAAPAANGYQNAPPPAPAAPVSPSDLNATPPAPGA